MRLHEAPCALQPEHLIASFCTFATNKTKSRPRCPLPSVNHSPHPHGSNSLRKLILQLYSKGTLLSWAPWVVSGVFMWSSSLGSEYFDDSRQTDISYAREMTGEDHSSNSSISAFIFIIYICLSNSSCNESFLKSLVISQVMASRLCNTFENCFLTRAFHINQWET